MIPRASPLCIDAFCGRWGWGRAFRDAGYRVIGIDNDPRSAKYADGMEFIEADIINVSGESFPPARTIVASPPCTEFSTAKNLSARWGSSREPEKGMRLVRAAVRFIRENRPTFWVIENVQGAVGTISKELGPPKLRKHAYYLWGNYPGFVLPSSNRLRKFLQIEGAEKTRLHFGYKGPRSQAIRSVIPYALARSLAEACLPADLTSGLPDTESR